MKIDLKRLGRWFKRVFDKHLSDADQVRDNLEAAERLINQLEAYGCIPDNLKDDAQKTKKVVGQLLSAVDMIDND